MWLATGEALPYLLGLSRVSWPYLLALSCVSNLVVHTGLEPWLTKEGTQWALLPDSTGKNAGDDITTLLRNRLRAERVGTKPIYLCCV